MTSAALFAPGKEDLTAADVQLYVHCLQVAEDSDIIFLAVKPQFVAPVLKEVRPHLTDNHTIVSIAAGKTLASLKASPPLLSPVYTLPFVRVDARASIAASMPGLKASSIHDMRAHAGCGDGAGMCTASRLEWPAACRCHATM